jgi:hypothetical protein
MPDTPTFAEWVIIELLGHRRLAGHLTEQQVAGHGFLRLDIPGDNDTTFATQLLSPSSVYAIHPTSEAIARHVAKTNRPEPVARWELPAAEPQYIVDGQPVDRESYEAWADEGRATADVDYDEGDVDDEGNPF